MITPQFLCELKVENNDNVFFDLGKPLTLTCEVSEDTEKADEITWSKDEKDLSDNVKVENKKSILTIEETENGDDGIYSCKYDNKKLEIKTIANILVKIKPSTDVAVVEGETLTLKCHGIGTNLQVSWILPNNTSEENVTYMKENEIENSILVLKDVKLQNRGSYICEGRHDESDKVVTSTAFVRVKDKYAALWPFILICIEVFVLCLLILICEKRRSGAEVEDSDSDTEQKNGRK
uniref:CSON011091 protein n=1 Tax=Culicoides sonorensis TaxID=179676 RepID=A0A336K4K8_CULSO